jgi:hypothetical protein
MPVENPCKDHIYAGVILFRASWISWCSSLVVSRSASSSCTSTYTETTRIDRSDSRSTTAVRSDDCTGTCSASMPFPTQSMLRNAYLSPRWTVVTTLVQFGCPIGAVTTRPSIVVAYGSAIANAPKSFSRSSFIKLSVLYSVSGHSIEVSGMYYASQEF